MENEFDVMAIIEDYELLSCYPEDRIKGIRKMLDDFNKEEIVEILLQVSAPSLSTSNFNYNLNFYSPQRQAK